MIDILLNEKKMIVTGNGRADDLYKLKAVVRRNTPEDCTLTHGELLKQVLDIATSALWGGVMSGKTHVYDASFPNGERVLFIRPAILPYGVSVETVRKTAR